MSGPENTFGNSEACRELWRIAQRERQTKKVASRVQRFQLYLKKLSKIEDRQLRVHLARLLLDDYLRKIPESFSGDLESFYRNVLHYSFRRYLRTLKEKWGFRKQNGAPNDTPA